MMVHGRQLSNVNKNWYREECGTFCAKCRTAYTFQESLELYHMNINSGMRHGIPRCGNCGASLRTRSRTNSDSGFWRTITKMNGELE